MKKNFINFTNHPLEYWGEKQREEALKYREILDVLFPAVDSWGNEEYISQLAEDCVEKILSLHPDAVLCQGEFCLAYQVICRLEEKGIPVLAACNERIVKEAGQTKEVVFSFTRFRGYE